MAITFGQGRKRTPIPRKGGSGNVFDNSVKKSTLSPEELERYRSGKHGGKSMEEVLTKEKYILFKEQGQTDKEIMEKYNLNHNQLHIMKRRWDLTGKFRSKRRTAAEISEAEEVQETSNQDAPIKSNQEQDPQETKETVYGNSSSGAEVEELKQKVLDLENEIKLLKEEHDRKLKEVVADCEKKIEVEYDRSTLNYRRAVAYSKALHHMLSKQKQSGIGLNPMQEALYESLAK